MLNVLAKTTALGAGNTVYLGKTRPAGGGGAWSQPASSIVDFSTNSLTDVMGPDTTASGWWGGAYSGVSNYTQDYGTAGGIGVSGGGHGNGSQNATFFMNAATRLYERVKVSATSFTKTSNGLVADSTTGWMYGDTAGSTIQVGEPFAPHHYAQLMAIPSTATPGGPAMGHLLTMGRSTMPTTAAAGTNQAHKFPLGGATSTKWAFLGTSLPANVGYGCTMYDSLRNRGIAIPDTGNQFHWLDCATGAQGSVTMSETSQSYYSIGAYLPAYDLYAYVRINSQTGQLIMKLINPVTGQVTNATHSGAVPDWSQFGDCPFAWNNTWSEVVMYRGNLNNMNRGKMPANILTQPITWSVAAFTGTAYSIYDIANTSPAYNRLQWDASRLVYHWLAKTNTSSQTISLPAV